MDHPEIPDSVASEISLKESSPSRFVSLLVYTILVVSTLLAARGVLGLCRGNDEQSQGVLVTLTLQWLLLGLPALAVAVRWRIGDPTSAMCGGAREVTVEHLAATPHTVHESASAMEGGHDESAGSPPEESTQAPTLPELYYLQSKGEESGPFTLGQVRTMWESGRITANAQYRLTPEGEMQPLIELVGGADGHRHDSSKVPATTSGKAEAKSSSKKPALGCLGVVMLLVTLAYVGDLTGWTNDPQSSNFRAGYDLGFDNGHIDRGIRPQATDGQAEVVAAGYAFDRKLDGEDRSAFIRGFVAGYNRGYATKMQ
jgi:hypothetical protein